MQSAHALPLSVATAEEAGGEWVELLPLGEIRARDGRSWRLDDVAQVIAESVPDAPLLIDLDHSADKGGATAAAGWIEELMAGGSHLLARVAWTPLGRRAIDDRTYRGISPTFLHDRAGQIRRVLRAALTNTPAIRQLAALAMEDPVPDTDTASPAEMADDRDSVVAIAARAALGLDADADAESVTMAIAALRQPDAELWVARAEYDALAADLAALRSAQAAAEAAAKVEAGVRAGKIPPAQREWAIAYAAADPVGFGIYLTGAPVLVTSASRADAPLLGSSPGALTEDQKAIAASCGIEEEAYRKALAARIEKGIAA